MQFKVMSRINARQYSCNHDIEDCIIISINDASDTANQFEENAHIKGICSLFFDDVEGDEKNCMTRHDADKIIEFVNTHLNDVNQIIVHCGAGVSRSAGVCAALMFIINGNDFEIFDKACYAPNMHCYRLVLESYFGYYDKEAADEKIKHNIAIWRKAEGLDD